MKDERGRVTISGFYDGIELDEATRAILRQTPDDEAEIRRRLGIAAPDAVAATLQEALQFPSLNIRGMASAWVGDQARTIIPATATAEIDIRLVPETSAERLVGLVRAHIEEQGLKNSGSSKTTRLPLKPLRHHPGSNLWMRKKEGTRRQFKLSHSSRTDRASHTSFPDSSLVVFQSGANLHVA